MSITTGVGIYPLLFWSALGEQTIQDIPPVLADSVITGGIFPLLAWSALGQQIMFVGDPGGGGSNVTKKESEELWFFRNRRRNR